MARKQKADQPKLVIDAALFLADKGGWNSVTPAAVARKTKLSETAVRALFPDTFAILRHILASLDEGTGAAAEKGAPWRDNMFEMLMTRFELIEKHRRAFLAIPEMLARHPKSAAAFAKRFMGSMAVLLKTAGAPASPLHAAALGGIYVSLVDVWRKDETPDLAKTMAAVDKRLELFEKVAGFCV